MSVTGLSTLLELDAYKEGGAHVLFRHTQASLMVQNGCDLLTIQHVLRHNDINTSMRYLHLAGFVHFFIKFMTKGSCDK